MFDLHLTEDGGAIVCDGDVSVWGDEDFVETCNVDEMVIGCTRGGERTSRSEGRANDVCDCPRGKDVGLEGASERGRSDG